MPDLPEKGAPTINLFTYSLLFYDKVLNSFWPQRNSRKAGQLPQQRNLKLEQVNILLLYNNPKHLGKPSITPTEALHPSLPQEELNKKEKPPGMAPGTE